MARAGVATTLVLAGAALVIFASEVTYRHTADALAVGTALTEARIAAAGVLQLLTDAETGQRGYLLTDRAEYLSPLDAAKLEVPSMRATVSAFLEASGPGGQAASVQMARHIEDTLAEIEGTVRLAQAGDRRAALKIVESGAGRRRMDDMRTMFSTGLSEAAGRQQTSRASIDDSLRFNRISVAALTLLGAVTLSLLLRRRRLHDEERASRQLDLEDQVRRRTAELSQLAGYLLTAREDEKAHLARELHDEMGSVLSAARLDVARMRRLAAEQPAMLERIAQLSQRLGEGIALKRRIVEDLRPSGLDTLGLTVSLSNLCADVSARLGVAILTDLDDMPLSAEAQLALYRFVQEALTNVSKYARASHISVYLKAEPNEVTVGVEDDGVGFDVSQLKAATHGIAGMRFRIERLQGRMDVASAPGQGTRLSAVLPR